jgi:hypothetical protein
MLFGDNVYFGSSAVDKIYLGDTEVWSAIPADVKAHIARVIADGGTVPEQAKMVSMVKKLMAANLWNNCVFFGLPLGGVKKDGNQFVSKVYDLKANADLVQGTGTSQPKYQTDGSLLYDGADRLASSALAVGSPIRTAVQYFTVTSWIYNPSTTSGPILTRTQGSSAPASSVWYLGVNGSKIELRLYNISTRKLWISNESLSVGWNQIGMTYNYENGALKMYLNGSEVTSISKNLDTDMTGAALANVKVTGTR